MPLSGIGYVGYINYAVLLFIITGVLLLYFDVNGYRMKGMKKEQKISRALGWINVSLGLLTYIGNVIFQNIFH